MEHKSFLRARAGDRPWNRLTTFLTEAEEEILERVVEQIVHVPVMKGRIRRGSLSENLSKFLPSIDSDDVPFLTLLCTGVRMRLRVRVMFDECVLGVRANVFTTNELQRKGFHEEQSSLSTTGGHSVRAVVNVHVVNGDR